MTDSEDFSVQQVISAGQLLDGLPIEFCREHRLLPVRCGNSYQSYVLCEAGVAPEDLDNAGRRVNSPLIPVMVDQAVLDEAIDRTFEAHAAKRSLSEQDDETPDAWLEPAEGPRNDLLESGDLAPVVGMVNRLLLDAAYPWTPPACASSASKTPPAGA